MYYLLNEDKEPRITMNNIIKQETEHPEKIADRLKAGIREFNRHYFGNYESTRYAFYIENEQGMLIAGVTGFAIPKHHALRIEFLYVEESHRLSGLGSLLLKTVEDHAKSMQCNRVQVSTMAFQGVEFYQKRGFQQVGIIPEWFCGTDEYFYVKHLSCV